MVTDQVIHVLLNHIKNEDGSWGGECEDNTNLIKLWFRTEIRL